MKKNHLVELYRFIIAVSILLFHLWESWSSDPKMWFYDNNLRMGVEFFFILSGFLLYLHCEKRENEKTIHYVLKRAVFYFPYFVFMWLFNGVRVSIAKDQPLVSVLYERLYYLLFLNNLAEESAPAFSGSGPLWYITTQIFATLFLHWIFQRHKELFKNILAPLFIMAGYSMVIRYCGGLYASQFTRFAGERVYFPFQLVRGIAGMSVGAVLAIIYKKASGYIFTPKTNIAGTISSLLLLMIGMGLSFRPENVRVNSYGWNSFVCIGIYAASILLAFVFSGNISVHPFVQRICVSMGKAALPMYMTHTVVVYYMEMMMDMSSWHKEYIIVLMLGTAVASISMEVFVRVFNNSCRRFSAWLKNTCIEGVR